MIDRFAVPVETRAPTGTTNTYFLEGASLLVDAAAPIDDLGIDPESVDHVAVTHSHPDHLAGLEAVMEATNATLWAKYGREGAIVEATGCVPEKTFRDGDTIGADGSVRVLETPGHAPDHVAFRVDSAAIVGDLAMADSSVVIGAPEGDVRAYLTSLRRLLTRPLSIAYPGHGQAIRSPRKRFAALIAHRLERERRVERAVIDGHRYPSEVVTVAYSKDLAGVEDLAERTVIAHLEKLAVENRVRWDGTVARPP